MLEILQFQGVCSSASFQPTLSDILTVLVMVATQPGLDEKFPYRVTPPPRGTLAKRCKPMLAQQQCRARSTHCILPPVTP